MDQLKEQHMLMIFDNCEEFFSKNKTSFELNLELWKEQMPNLSIIFISTNQLEDLNC